ncbi:MAG: alpha-L-arabinofuranosidase C-terminal domain-containing protein [Lentisphaeria bacterium]
MEAQTSPANIVIHPHREIGPVAPGIFGSFIENLNNCIYGGVFDPACPTANHEGFRTDVMAAARAMGVSVVRFPGGCFAPYYHWQDGIGPREKRPLTRYRNVEWREQNSFGTDEFVSWCRQIDAEPFICVNMGSGTPEEARNWVEYCNGRAGSRWADLRIANGHEQPHQVKYWALGNEISGDWEFGYAPTPEDYIRRAREFARVMKHADPAIRLVLAGSHFPLNHQFMNWNRDVLDQLFNYVDYISMHHYIGLMGRSGCGGKQWETLGALKVHHKLTEYMAEVEDACRVVREDIRLIKHRHKNLNKQIGLALDEYNPWYRTWEGDPAVGLCEQYSLADSLLVAAYFNIFVRNADVLTLANMAQLVNVLPALVCQPGSDRFYRQGISYVQELFLANRGLVAVDAWCQAPTFAGEFYPQVPYLDVSASVMADRTQVILNVINRHPEQALTLAIQVTGCEITAISGQMLGGGALEQTNDFAAPERLSIQPIPNVHRQQPVVPPASTTVFRLTVG